MTILRFLPRFRKAYRELDELAVRERWSRDRIERFQLDRLNDVWQHARAYVPYYRRLASQNALPGRFSSLEEYHQAIPILPKAEVRARPRDFLSERPRPGGWERTGGSTGTPMSTYWARESHREMLRAKYRHFAAWGVGIFDSTAFLWGHSASVKPGMPGRLSGWLQSIQDRLRNRTRFSAYRLGHHDLRAYLRRMKTVQPVSMYGYSRALYSLAQEAEALDFHCESLRLFTLTGEPAFPYMVETIERVFGVPAVVEYGSIECGAIASEWPDRTLRVREDMVLVETEPREDGRFDIIISVLNNPSYPLLRYAIADVTDAPLERPENGFAILKNVAGRNNDFILTRTGRWLHSARFDAFFKYQSKGIRRFRMRQRADGSISATLEIEEDAPAVDTKSIQRGLRDLVEGYSVRVETVDSITQTAAGKHRLVVSDLIYEPAAGNGVHRHPDGKAEPSDSKSHLPSGTSTDRKADAAKPGSASGTCHSLPTEDAASPSRQSSSSEMASKATRFRQLIERPELAFIMEAHNGLSARIVEEAGFDAIWGSGLAISAALGVRDSNEASWTQVLETLEFMSDATRIPILVDGDTGYGNFNNMRRFVRKLENRGIAGVCIEDKIFPKTNSFLNGKAQPLADIDEFCGRISAGKDAQQCDDFVIVARVEAFIAGWGLDEALKRADAYHRAGADAILMHSALRSPEEILAFKREWGDRSPVVIVPTKYYSTPTEVFRHHGFSAVIWANHLMRSCITAMQRTAQEIFEDQTLINVEDRVAPLGEVFRIQGAPELSEAEKRYLPKNAATTRAIVLAASQGGDLGTMTDDRPKCMVNISGKPLLTHILDTYRAAGIKDISVVRGYRKDAVKLDGVTYYDNAEPESTADAYSLYQALPALDGPCIISFGDVLFKKYIAEELTEMEADFAVFVDVNWRESRNRGRYADYVTCSLDSSRHSFLEPVGLVDVSNDIEGDQIHGEWMGFLKVSAEGARQLGTLLEQLHQEGDKLRQMNMAGLLRELLKADKEIRVAYTAGHWFDVDSVQDVIEGSAFS